MTLDWKIDIQVFGKPIKEDIGRQLQIVDISREMDEVASWIGYWAGVWGEAEKEKVMVDGEYRHWRAKITLAMLASPKAPNAEKIKATIEGDPKFREWKAAIGTTEKHVTLLKGIFEAWKAKANQLQSKGARERTEMEKTGMRTMETPRAAPVDHWNGDDIPEFPTAAKVPLTDDQKKARMREINAKKKAASAAPHTPA